MQRESDNNVLKAIEDNNLIFISAQPDEIYFHWQVSLYLYQFAKHGIISKCYALFGYTEKTPSDYVIKLATKYPNVKYYKDTRKDTKKGGKYPPSIRPHILAKFFKDFPNLGRNVFYHDSDIFLTKLPRFDLMLGPYDQIGYLSNTISYIGYNYIKLCSERYKEKHQLLQDLDIFYGMCDVMKIDPEIVKQNENNSGGAQYLLRDIDYAFWSECEIKCDQLYDYLANYENRYRIVHPIQKWTTDMWVVLWTYWKQGKNTKIHNELDFSWGTGTVDDYNRLNIFHLAGITAANSSDKFHKGRYTKQLIFDAYIKNPNIFNHVSRTNATYEYVNVIKEYINNIYLVEKGISSSSSSSSSPVPRNQYVAISNSMKIDQNNQNNQTDRQIILINPKKFIMHGHKHYGNMYQVDESKICCGKPIWRAIDRTYIIFWSGTSWILTNGVYENDIGPNVGGLASVRSENPYDNKWNINVNNVLIQ